jgi:hypothetical protein
LKKTALLITLGIMVLLIGTYYSYEKFFVKKPLDLWALVPSDALLVYEKNQCSPCVDALVNSTVSQVLKKASSHSHPVDSLQAHLFTLAENASSLMVSVHATKKDDFDFILYTSNAREVDKLLQSFAGFRYTVTTRAFNDVQINEVKFSKHKFSFVRLDNVWVGTYTPFLIEDVIRTFKQNGPASKNSAYLRQNFSSVADDAGNVYVNLKNFNRFLSLFSSGKNFDFPFGISSALDIKNEEKAVVLNGFSYDTLDANSQYALSIFRHQSPVSFNLRELISNRSLAVTAYGISDGKKFGVDLLNFTKLHNKSFSDSLAKLSSAYKFSVASLYNSIKDEVAVSFFEGNKGNSVRKILLIRTTDPAIWLKTFNSLSERLSVDTVFREQYSDFEIREVPIYRFSEKLLYPLVSGFSQNYYTTIGKVVVIADNLEALKNYLDDVNDEDTWGKSVAQNRFLESTLLESNISLYFNPARAFNYISHHLQGRWVEFARQNQNLIQAIQMSSIQFSHLNNSYYTNVLFTYKDFDTDTSVKPSGGDRILVNFDHRLLKIFAVRSHVNRSNEILLQDSVNDLSLVSSEGKVLWKIPLRSPIISDVTQIDFFNNGKLQYFFATDHALHVIDRLGNYVNNYPVDLSAIEIEFVSIVDYDNSKKYRFLVADKKGGLWMYDKEGNNLEGWNPKTTGGPLAFAPRHHRIKGKDYVVAARADGRLLVTSRRGDNLKNFPINMDANPMGDFSLDVGSTLSDTYFTFVSLDGFRIRISPEAKIQNKEPLVKTSIRSTFSLINEKALKSYLIVQQDNKQLTVMDESGRRIFTTESTSAIGLDIKYYEFGSGNSFILLSDRGQGLSYVYDGRGNLLTTPPIESSHIEIRPTSSDEFRLFFIHDNVLTIQPL